MKITLKRLFGGFVVAALLGLVAGWVLQMRAQDFWGFGVSGVSDGTPESPVYHIEVGGVDDNPTVARLVRFEDSSKSPANVLEISHGVSAALDQYTQNADRWNAHCILIAGRTNEEKVVIPIEMATAKTLFGRPGVRFKDFERIDMLWADYVAAHMAGER